MDTAIVSLTHITDVGASSGNGVDSTLRIRKQYERLGVLVPNVISAGHSPLHVAFAAITDTSTRARDNVKKINDITGDKPVSPPIALNSAPRNSRKSYRDGKEDYIYRVYINNGEIKYLLYGPDVLKWLLVFYGTNNVKVDKVLAINGVIEDTSRGSQFRSAEHLPIIHVLETRAKLTELAVIENVPLDSIQVPFTDRNKTVVVVPPDEYGNGRLLVNRELMKKILDAGVITIPAISDHKLHTAESLTNVEPDTLSLWPSSNFFPDESLAVLNVGTRWKPGTTRTTNLEVIELSKKLSLSVGKQYEVVL